MKTCQQCTNNYNQSYKNKIIRQASEVSSIKSTNTQNLCLECIIKNIQEQAISQTPALAKAIAIHKHLDLATKKALYKKETLKKEYDSLDRQQSFITFFIHQAEARAKARIKAQAKTSNKSKSSPEDIITMLKQLPPEQREAILALAKAS